MFKKSIVAALAFTLLGTAFAQAQSPYPPRRDEPRMMERHGRDHGPRHDMRRDDRREFHRNRWSKGQRYGDWRRHNEVRDYKRYGLRRPGHGQRWVKVDNQFLLISTATGIIAGILAAR